MVGLYEGHSFGWVSEGGAQNLSLSGLLMYFVLMMTHIHTKYKMTKLMTDLPASALSDCFCVFGMCVYVVYVTDFFSDIRSTSSSSAHCVVGTR